MSIASWTSPPASAFTFPISCVMRSVSSALCSATSWAKRKRISPRFGAGTSRQSSYAAFAAATARSTSSASERGKTPMSSPSAGLVDSKVSPERASTHSPPMWFRNVRVCVVAMSTSLSPQFGVMNELYLDPRDAEYAETLPPEERDNVLATVMRFRRPERLRVGDALPERELLRLEDGRAVALGSLVTGKPLVLVFGSFT